MVDLLLLLTLDNLSNITTKNGTLENTNMAYRFVKCGKVVLLAIHGLITISSDYINKKFVLDLPKPIYSVRFTLNAANSSYGSIEIDITSEGDINLIFCSTSLSNKKVYVQGTVTYITS